ncbi:MAG TPA: hypothetical protein VF893_07995, partial [Candidatus Bathyarchaeia archaeon]
MNNKAVSVILLILIGVSLLAMSLPSIQGQLGVNIFQVTPTEGTAGDKINVQGTINSADGEYRLYLGNTLVATNNSEGFYVNANFSVPEIQSGAYTLTLRDVTNRINATSSFTVQTGYFIKAVTPPSPSQMQEGNDLTLRVTVTGGKQGTAYAANVTVMLPSPLLTEYSQTVALSAPGQT